MTQRGFWPPPKETSDEPQRRKERRGSQGVQPAATILGNLVIPREDFDTDLTRTPKLDSAHRRRTGWKPDDKKGIEREARPERREVWCRSSPNGAEQPSPGGRPAGRSAESARQRRPVRDGSCPALSGLGCFVRSTQGGAPASLALGWVVPPRWGWTGTKLPACLGGLPVRSPFCHRAGSLSSCGAPNPTSEFGFSLSGQPKGWTPTRRPAFGFRAGEQGREAGETFHEPAAPMNSKRP